MKISPPTTWANLRRYYSCYREARDGENPFYEPFTHRRYNPSRIDDTKRVRLVFLDCLLEEYPQYKTLPRKGRPIWCENLSYEGVVGNRRYFGFNIKGGKKRFIVPDCYCFLLPARVYVYPNFPTRLNSRGICSRIGSVFAYPPVLKMMYRNRPQEDENYDEFTSRLSLDSPIRPGALVRPRIGLYRPIWNKEGDPPMEDFHPYGLVICREKGKYYELYGRELFTVAFGEDMVSNIHPIEMEVVINDERKKV